MSKSVFAGKEWQQALSDMISALSGPNFFPAFAHGCELISGYQSALIVWVSTDHKPINLYDDLLEEHALPSTKPWLEGAYLLDPFYALFRNNAPEGIYRLRDLAPDNFYKSDYYRSFYTQTGLTDECGVLVNLDENHSILISLGSRGQPEIKPIQLADLQLVMPVLSALCRKQQSAADGEITFSAPLDRAFRNFGRDHLSARECEVVQLILKGHSNKSIAKLLNISVDTVKVYNKRFHTKLDVSSQAELFSLFLEAISLVPFDVDIDPLTHYLEITRTP
ncbi:MAG: helix-turn-helix transcriptional regulator [Halioglobus sp.]